jgi:ABC-type glycerol-3-phosphate transport system permease component
MKRERATRCTLSGETSVPTVVLFVLLRKYFMAGLQLGK